MRSAIVSLLGAFVHFHCVLAISAPQSREHTSKPGEKEIAPIRQLLERQQADWNRGDIEAFMRGYDAGVVFASGDTIQRGWKETLERYKARYPNRESMGTLSFSELEITLLGDDAAVVLGRWELKRKSGRSRGIFSLTLRKGADGWKIIQDHTSSSP
jgi:ketosteroid isomerase-like protein